jgi:hypothetical protein
MQTKILLGFCIYGTERKYYQGLIENIDLIALWKTKKPEVNIEVIINYTETAIESYLELYRGYPFVKMEIHRDNDVSPTIARITNIDKIPEDSNTYYFSRDADSRITDRDMWCTEEFINSGKTFHVIRDHYYHKRLIMAGTFGIKKPKGFPDLKPILKEWKKTRRDTTVYGIDEIFLQEQLYPLIQDNYLVHSNIRGYKGETVFPILREQEDDGDFIGNVYEYNDNNIAIPYFSYKQYVSAECLLDSWRNEQYRITAELLKYVDISSLHERREVLDACYQFFLSTNNTEKQKFILDLLEKNKN